MFNKPIRYSAILLALMFVIFGLLQYNDPDPYVWMPIYWIAAGISISVALNRINIILLWIAMVVFVLWALYMWAYP
jgi:formate hydrogenlyase subunit 3/multisubunit Na+/H+ antiporter MnhD subunit